MFATFAKEDWVGQIIFMNFNKNFFLIHELGDNQSLNHTWDK